MCRCVVWTGDGRVFFYNPSSRTSVWERPEELVGRADVDKMVASAPESAQPLDSQANKRENSSDTEQTAKKLKLDPGKVHKMRTSSSHFKFYSYYKGVCNDRSKSDC